MSALADSCGAGASAAIGVVHLNAGQGVAMVLALVGVGMLLNAGLHRWVEAGDEQIAAALQAVEDESLAMVTEVTAPYTGAGAVVPAQRVSNGEDLLGGDFR